MSDSTRAFILGLQTIKNASLIATPELYAKVGSNTGNLAFQYAISHHLRGPVSTDWSAPIDEIHALGNFAVIPCANQLGSHISLGWAVEKFEKLKVGMAAIGLGAQSGVEGEIPEVPTGTIAWLNTVVAHAKSSEPNISVRGAHSLRVLEHFGLGKHAVITGCPSLFINPSPTLGELVAQNFREPKRVAVAAGHPQWKHLARIEASLAHIVTATHGSYIGQSPLVMLKLTRNEVHLLSEEELVQCRDYAAPEMSTAEFKRWVVRYGHVFFDVPSWMEHYRHFDFVVGTRIHGVALALQAGIPALCITHDSRTVELCKTMLIPYVRASDVSGGLHRDDLRKYFATFDPTAFDKNRRALAAAYVSFLKANTLCYAPPLDDLSM